MIANSWAARRRELARALRAVSDSPEQEARWLIDAALARTKPSASSGIAVPEPLATLAADAELWLAAAVDRRLADEPLERIIGRRGFWTLDLAVTPATLSPRPDTETIVEAALAEAPPGPLSILDLGTGTGAILLALLAEWGERARGIGVDISGEALAVAMANAADHGLSGRCRFIQGGWDADVPGPFDIVVSNPPYIPTGDIPGLDRSVKDHDPWLALDGGPDGLDAYRAILARLPALLREEGRAILELGFGQAPAVTTIAIDMGMEVLTIRPDLSGIPRAMVLRRRSSTG